MQSVLKKRQESEAIWIILCSFFRTKPRVLSEENKENFKILGQQDTNSSRKKYRVLDTNKSSHSKTYRAAKDKRRIRKKQVKNAVDRHSWNIIHILFTSWVWLLGTLASSLSRSLLWTMVWLCWCRSRWSSHHTLRAWAATPGDPLHSATWSSWSSTESQTCRENIYLNRCWYKIISSFLPTAERIQRLAERIRGFRWSSGGKF